MAPPPTAVLRPHPLVCGPLRCCADTRARLPAEDLPRRVHRWHREPHYWYRPGETSAVGRPRRKGKARCASHPRIGIGPAPYMDFVFGARVSRWSCWSSSPRSASASTPAACTAQENGVGIAAEGAWAARAAAALRFADRRRAGGARHCSRRRRRPLPRLRLRALPLQARRPQAGAARAAAAAGPESGSNNRAARLDQAQIRSPAALPPARDERVRVLREDPISGRRRLPRQEGVFSAASSLGICRGTRSTPASDRSPPCRRSWRSPTTTPRFPSRPADVSNPAGAAKARGEKGMPNMARLRLRTPRRRWWPTPTPPPPPPAAAAAATRPAPGLAREVQPCRARPRHRQGPSGGSATSRCARV